MHLGCLGNEERRQNSAVFIFGFVINKPLLLEASAEASHCSNYTLRSAEVPEIETRTWLNVGVHLVESHTVDFVACAAKATDVNWGEFLHGLLHLFIEMAQRACCSDLEALLKFCLRIKRLKILWSSLI